MWKPQKINPSQKKKRYKTLRTQRKTISTMSYFGKIPTNKKKSYLLFFITMLCYVLTKNFVSLNTKEKTCKIKEMNLFLRVITKANLGLRTKKPDIRVLLQYIHTIIL